MALTIRERAFAEALVRLKAIASVPGLTAAHVERNRREPVAERPAIVLYDGAHDIVDRWSGVEMYRERFDVELHGAASQTPGASVNELWGAAKAALVADVTLGGLAFDLREAGSDDPEFEPTSAGPLGGFLLRFEVDLMVKENDPTALAP